MEKNKKINKTDMVLFLILNILTIIIFLPWLLGHYATDTYNVMNVGYEYYSLHNSLVDGRFFMFVIMQLAEIVNIKCEILVALLLFLAIAVSNVSVWLIKNIVIDKMKNRTLGNYIMSYIIAYSLIYNFMYIENLYFLECFVMAIAILLNLIVAKIYFEEGKHYLIKTLTILLISMFCYQGTISTFIVFTLMFLLINKCDIKKSLKKIFAAIIITGVVCIVNLMFVKIISNLSSIEQNRLNYNIFNNIIYILSTKFLLLYTTSNNFYPCAFIIFAIILVEICMLCLNLDKKEKLMLIFSILIILFSVDLPYVISLTAFYAGRTRFGIGALIAIVLIYVIQKFNSRNECNKEKNKMQTAVYVIAITWFVINIINYVDIISNAKITNACEKEYVKSINEYITEYEKENNIKVEKIQLVYDSNENSAFYDACTRKNVTTWNAVSCSWSAIGVINFYSNRNLQPLSSDYITMDFDGRYKITDDVLHVKIAVI